MIYKASAFCAFFFLLGYVLADIGVQIAALLRWH